MANTIETIFGPQPAGIGNRHTLAVRLSLTTYSAGGIAVPVPASITQPVVLTQADNGYVAGWDGTNGKVKLYTAPKTEATSITGTVNVTVLFIGQ